MEVHEARQILRDNKVDFSFDPRDPRVIVEFLNNLGHLGSIAETEVVAEATNQVIMENR